MYDEGYDWGPQTQLRVAADCDAAALDKGLVADGEVYCVLNELRDWYPDAFPYESATVLHDALLDFYATSTYAQLKLDHENYASLTGFTSTTDGVAGGAVKAIFHAFNATIRRTRPTPGSTGPCSTSGTRLRARTVRPTSTAFTRLACTAFTTCSLRSSLSPS